jgi:hypothetical protein
MFLEHLLAHAIFRTRAGQFFGGLMLVAMVIALPFICVFLLSVFAWNEVSLESSYAKRFGPNWKTQYEERQGSLSKARVRASLAVLAVATNGFVGVWLYRQLFGAMRNANRMSGSTRQRHRKRRRRSFVSAKAQGPAALSPTKSAQSEQARTTAVFEWNGEPPPLRDPQHRSEDDRGEEATRPGRAIIGRREVSPEALKAIQPRTSEVTGPRSQRD